MASWSENFDGVTVPALPSTISVDNGTVITSTTTAFSSPNAIRQNVVDADPEYHSVSSGVGADAVAQARINFQQGSSFVGVFVGARRQSDGSAYIVQIKQGFSDSFVGVQLYKRSGGHSGTYTAIGGAVSVSLTTATWYLLKIVPTGTTIEVRLQRPSDSNWLNSSGSWVSGETSCISQTDATISAAGELMVTTYSSTFTSPGTTEPPYLDSLSYADPGGGGGGFALQPGIGCGLIKGACETNMQAGIGSGLVKCI